MAKYLEPKRKPGTALFTFEGGPWMGQTRALEAREVREFWWAPTRDIIYVMPHVEIAIFKPEDPFAMDDAVSYVDHQYRFRHGPTRDDWRFFWRGPQRDDWGPKYQLDEVAHQIRYLLPVWEQLKAQMFPPPRLLWTFPERLAPQVSVYRGLQVVHTEIPYPTLSIKPDYPTWGEVAGEIARIRGRLSEY